jgi:hypothetical protein
MPTYLIFPFISSLIINALSYFIIHLQ